MNSRILPVVALIAAIGIFFVYVRPTWVGPIADAKAAIAADNQALAAADAFTAQQNALLSAQNAINPEDLKRLAIFLPDSVDNVGLILDLNALAARAGLSLSNVNIAANSSQMTNNASAGIPPSAIDTPMSSADLSLSAIGTYSAFQSFLRSVENSERLLDVRGVSIKGSDTGVYTYQMTIRLYWLH